MFDSVGRVGGLVHHTDAASWERDGEGTVHESVVLVAETQPGVREESQGVDGLFESCSVVEVLG